MILQIPILSLRPSRLPRHPSIKLISSRAERQLVPMQRERNVYAGLFQRRHPRGQHELHAHQQQVWARQQHGSHVVEGRAHLLAEKGDLTCSKREKCRRETALERGLAEEDNPFLFC